MADKGIHAEFIPVDKGMTRINVKLRSEQESEINGQGPAIAASDIDKLYEKITEMFNLNEINLDNENVITNVRQKNLITKAIENVKKAKKTIEQKMPIDIVAIFIKDILEDLGKITGEVVTEDIIEEIFANFCLGK